MNISCKTSAVRTSRLRDKQLRGVRKLELWYHIMICRFCRIYDRQIKKLGSISRLVGEASETGDAGQLKLSDDAKTRIKRNLRP
jgi:hypothetical protein